MRILGSINIPAPPSGKRMHTRSPAILLPFSFPDRQPVLAARKGPEKEDTCLRSLKPHTRTRRMD